MAAQAVVDHVRTGAKWPRGTLGAVALTGCVLLVSVLLSAGEAAAHLSPGEGTPQPSVRLSDSDALPRLGAAERVTLTLRNDGEPDPFQCAYPCEGDPCDRGYAEHQVEVTTTLTTKSMRARAIQTATHESIGDFVLPADLPQAQREAIILSVAARESGGHEFNNEMVSAGWSRGVMQITSDCYVGAGNGGCASEDCKYCRDRSDVEACYRYYSNTLDGITRNVRDGLYAFQDKHGLGYPATWESVDLDFGEAVTAAEMKWMFVLKRYGPNYDAVKPFHYVREIGKLLGHELDTHYDDQPTYPELGQKLSHAHGHIISSSGPVDLRARDSQDRITGRVGETLEQGIPNAWYNRFRNRITLLFPADALHYQIVGREDGAYGLQAVAEPEMEAEAWSDSDSTAASFALADVPIEVGAVHEYAVDWESGGKTATRRIDADGDGDWGEPITIHVPEASFTAAPPSPHSGDSVTFDASASSDPDDNIASYHWDFGDGGQSDAGPRVDYRYASPGSYTVRLTVRDQHGAIDTSSASLTVIFEVTDVVYIPLVFR